MAKTTKKIVTNHSNEEHPILKTKKDFLIRINIGKI